MKRLFFAIVLVLFASAAQADEVLVFAAASLKNAFDAIGEEFTEVTGTDVTFVYAGTATLARQIEQGAPAHLFASAHPDWTGYLVERDLLQADTVVDFASNALVLIASKGQGEAQVTSLFDLPSALGDDERLAVAHTGAVPAGIYAREALIAAGVWEEVNPRLAETDNVRSTLHFVALGEAPFGIVYRSDTLAEDQVVVVSQIDPSTHSPIRYSIGITSSDGSQAARALHAFLLGPTASDLLSQNGFSAVPTQ